MLRVRDLNVFFQTQKGEAAAVREFDLDVNASDTLSIVGESGSGKTVAMLAILGLLSGNARYYASEITFEGVDLLKLSGKQRRKFLGPKISMIFQDPINSLNPSYKVGRQMAELFQVHKGLSYKDSKKLILDLFEQVGISDAENRMNSYPHQLSGGMNQRVMIALAIALKPKLLIADEPTTALDVTIQAQILNLLRKIKEENDMAVILISHDIGVVAHLADEVITMYHAWQVERSPIEKLISKASHPYSIDLINSVPEMAVGKRFRVISQINNQSTDGLNGCIYYPWCTRSSAECLHKIEYKKVNGSLVRCIKAE